jgi:hypothetical protein
MTTFRLVNHYRRFGRACYLHANPKRRQVFSKPHGATSHNISKFTPISFCLFTPMVRIPLLHTVLLYAGKTPAALHPVPLADMEGSRAKQALQGKPYYVPGALQWLRTLSQIAYKETSWKLSCIWNAFCMSTTNIIWVPGEETKLVIHIHTYIHTHTHTYAAQDYYSEQNKHRFSQNKTTIPKEISSNTAVLKN